MPPLSEKQELSLMTVLQRSGKLNAAGLKRAETAAAASGDQLHLVLCRLGLISEHDMALALADSLDLKLVRDSDYPATPLYEYEITTDFLRNSQILPISDDDAVITVAMANPLDQDAIDALELLFDKPVRTSVAVPTEIDRHITRLYGHQYNGNEFSIPAPGINLADIEHLRDLASDVPVVQVVNRMISNAVANRASDIHIEIYADTIHVRERIDGMLTDVYARTAWPIHGKPCWTVYRRRESIATGRYRAA